MSQKINFESDANYIGLGDVKVLRSLVYEVMNSASVGFQIQNHALRVREFINMPVIPIIGLVNEFGKVRPIFFTAPYRTT